MAWLPFASLDRQASRGGWTAVDRFPADVHRKKRQYDKSPSTQDVGLALGGGDAELTTPVIRHHCARCAPFGAARDRALEPAGDRLRYDAPRGALTPELRTAMAEYKPELLSLLNRRVGTGMTDLVEVAELLIAGQMLNWPALPVAPQLAIVAGEEGWLRFLKCPPPGTLEAALEAAKARIQKERPL